MQKRKQGLGCGEFGEFGEKHWCQLKPQLLPIDYFETFYFNRVCSLTLPD
ncbi:MAG: hypothetical protein F6J86_05570 [Symploca sp. SIO1B1]|nr:hypothetical protein [Symploca sp. SIO1B1]